MAFVLMFSQVPLFATTYALAGFSCGILWLFRPPNKVLPALSGLVLAIAAWNAYVEEWNNLKSLQIEKLGLVLLAILLWPYTMLCVRLVTEQTGIRNRSLAARFAFLPVLYVLSLGLAVVSPELTTNENPAFALYLGVVLVCVIHAPTFAFGKSQAIKVVRKDLSLPSHQKEMPASLLRNALPALALPLLITLGIQIAERDDWRLFASNALLSIAIISLFLFSGKQLTKST